MSTDQDIDPLSADSLEGAQRTSRCIALEAVDNSILLDGITLWRSLCRGQKFPSRNDVTPRALKGLLRNTTLVKVIDGGKDYEYRIVGDAYVLAHGTSFQGRLWSDTAKFSPGYKSYIKPIYDKVVREAQPVATRGWIERGVGSTGRVFCEYVFLPLGETDVDHILIFAVYLRRDGLEHVASGFTGSFGA
jgi:hypothetical protein